MDDYGLPSVYGKSRLVLLAVNPYLIHAYWEVAPEDLDKAKEQSGQAQEVLRFYKTGKMATEDDLADSFDVEIDLQSRNWYVHLWSAEESYVADLALKTKNGMLIRLVRSAVVRMPRLHPAIPIDQHWMKVEPAERLTEIVPPPAEHKPPQEAAASRVNELNELISRQRISKPVDSPALYENASQALIERPYRRVPQAEGAVGEAQPLQCAAGFNDAQARAERERDSAKPHTMPAAGTNDRPDIDLAAMAERNLAPGLSSASLQRGGTDDPPDRKK